MRSFPRNGLRKKTSASILSNRKKCLTSGLIIIPMKRIRGFHSIQAFQKTSLRQQSRKSAKKESIVMTSHYFQAQERQRHSLGLCDFFLMLMVISRALQ